MVLIVATKEETAAVLQVLINPFAFAWNVIVWKAQPWNSLSMRQPMSYIKQVVL
jgi:hypothetical protein